MRTQNYALVYRVLGYAQTVFFFSAGTIAALMKAKPAEWKDHLGELGALIGSWVAVIQSHTWWLSPSLLLLAASVRWCRKRVGDPVIWKDLQDLMDEYRDDIFGALEGKYHHHYRVTLYQYRRKLFAWPVLSHWLLPYVRSGHTSKSNVRSFRVNPQRPGCPNGVAGKAWESRGAVCIEDLGKLTPESSLLELQMYASQTNITLKSLQKKLSSSRSFWAVRVQVKGANWGVFVVDCVDEKMPTKKAAQAFGKGARAVSLLLSRA